MYYKTLLSSFFISLFLFPNALAQNLDDLIRNNKTPDCEEVSEVTSQMIAKYIKSNNLDSAKVILEYWENKCKASEPIIRSKILLSLMENNYKDSILGENYMWYIFNYKNRIKYVENSKMIYNEFNPYFGFVPVGKYFDNLTKEKFSELKLNFTKNNTEYLLADFYSDHPDSIFHTLQNDTFSNTEMVKQYQKEVLEIKKLGEVHFAWITGAWIPTGKLKTLGIHPDLGFLAGWKKDKTNFDLIMTFKFLKAQNEYTALRKSSNTSETTDHFFGGQIGFEIGQDILVKRKHEVQIIAGISMDGIDVLKENQSQNLKAQSIISYNINIGLGYRLYTNGKFYLGARAKYNLIDYTINNAIDLTGNSFSLQFIVGSVSNFYKMNMMESLGQKLRQ